MKNIIFVIALLVAISAHASNIDHVNIGRIAVDDQSLRSQQKAGKLALAQVFVKISGDPQVLKANEISRAVDNYEQFLVSSSFLQQAQSLMFEATFNQQKVEQLLMASGLNVWTSLRPSAVLWLAKQDEMSQKLLVSQNQSLEIGALVQQQGFVRGVEIVVPVGDLDDAMNVSIYDVWNQFVSRLVRQSARYNTDYVISATMQGFSSEAQAANQAIINETVPDWMNSEALRDAVDIESLGSEDIDSIQEVAIDNSTPDNMLFVSEISTSTIQDKAIIPDKINIPEDTTHKLDYAITNGRRVFTGRLYGVGEDDLVIQLVNEYANLLAQEFSLVGSNGQENAPQSGSIQLVANNITSLADYVDLISLIESIPAVFSAKLMKQANTTAFITIEQAVGKRQLEAILALDKRMQIDLSKNQQPELYFNWQD